MRIASESPQRVLIVSVGTNEKTCTAVRALRAAADRQWPGIEVHSVDLLATLHIERLRTLQLLCSAYDRWFPQAQQAGSGAWSGRQLAPLIDRIRPDIVLSTHPLGSRGLDWLRRHRGLALPTGVWRHHPAAHGSGDNGSGEPAPAPGVLYALDSTRDSAVSRSLGMDLEEGLRRIAAIVPTPQPRPLQAPDALFLHVDTPLVPQYVGTVLVFEPGPGLTRQQAAEMLSAVPGLTGRFRPATLFRKAHWSAVPDQDPLRLVDEVHTDDLTAAVDEFFSVPLKTDHAVGAARLVTGLPEGRRALLIKLHHALGDGVSVLQALLSDSDNAARLSWARRPAVSLGGTRFRPDPRRLMRGLWQLTRAGRAPHTCLDRTTDSARRRHDLIRLPGRHVRRCARGLGLTPPELLLTLFAESVHRLLDTSAEHGFRLMVPSSIRGMDSLRVTGNHTGAVPVDLPLGPMSVQRRAQLVSRVVQQRVAAGVPEAAHLVVRMLGWLPAGLQRVVAKSMYQREWFNAIGTVLPGPRSEVRWREAVLSAAYPVLALAPGTGLAWGAMTWGDWITVGFTGTAGLGPLVERLGRQIPIVLAELAAEDGMAPGPEEEPGR